MTEKILIPWDEFRDGNKRWKILNGGLLQAPDGRTEFPTTNPAGEVIGTHSYYLDHKSAPVEVRYSSEMTKRMGID